MFSLIFKTVEFVRRQTNMLTSITIYLSRFHIFIDISYCIQHIIINEMVWFCPCKKT